MRPWCTIEGEIEDMASKTQVVVRRAAPVVPKKKYELAVKAGQLARARGKQAAQERMGAIIGGAAGYGVGYLEKKGTRLPTVFGLEPTLLYGGLLTFGPALLGIRGQTANMAAEGGATLLGIAGYKAGLGMPMVGEDD